MIGVMAIHTLQPVYVMSDISDRNFKNLGFQKNKNTLKTLNPFIEKERKPDKYRAKNMQIVTP